MRRGTHSSQVRGLFYQPYIQRNIPNLMDQVQEEKQQFEYSNSSSSEEEEKKHQEAKRKEDMENFLNVMETRIKQYRQDGIPAGQPLYNFEALSIQNSEPFNLSQKKSVCQQSQHSNNSISPQRQREKTISKGHQDQPIRMKSPSYQDQNQSRQVNEMRLMLQQKNFQLAKLQEENKKLQGTFKNGKMDNQAKKICLNNLFLMNFPETLESDISTLRKAKEQLEMECYQKKIQLQQLEIALRNEKQANRLLHDKLAQYEEEQAQKEQQSQPRHSQQNLTIQTVEQVSSPQEPEIFEPETRQNDKKSQFLKEMLNQKIPRQSIRQSLQFQSVRVSPENQESKKNVTRVKSPSGIQKLSTEAFKSQFGRLEAATEREGYSPRQQILQGAKKRI